MCVCPCSKDDFKPSHTSSGPNSTTHDPAIRLSTVASLNHSDNTVACITQRARALQGWRENLFIETLKIQRYAKGGHYIHHFDWAGAGLWDRISSFMVYVKWDSDGRGGGTGFPRLRRPRDGRWCEWIECPEMGKDLDGDDTGEEDGMGLRTQEGVVFKPIAGNAIFWENLRSDGSGYDETWHAGLPVEQGEKVGLNLWSWYRFG